MKLSVSGITALALSGCASTGVIPVGKDTFMISDKASTGYTSAGSIKAGIYKEGAKYCASQGKEFQPIHETSVDGTPSSWHWASAEIHFRCLNKNDPEFYRPTLEKDADIKIQSAINQKTDIKNNNNSDLYTELTKIKSLLDSKIITQEEFDAQKKVILDKYK